MNLFSANMIKQLGTRKKLLLAFLVIGGLSTFFLLSDRSFVAAQASLVTRLHVTGEASEHNGAQNGAVVTPQVGPTGTLAIAGTGNVNHAAGALGNGVYFTPGGQQNSNYAFYRFTGASLGSMFDLNNGEINFILKSRSNFANRGARDRVFEITDGTQQLFTLSIDKSFGSLILYYRTGGSTLQYYYFPSNTAFEAGTNLAVRITWNGTTSQLYLNNLQVNSAADPKLTPNWTANATIVVGGQADGYYSCTDIIDEYKILGPSSGCATVINPASLPNGTVGTAYHQTLTATGAPGAVTWSTSTGLPPGLTLHAATGVISGTPTVAGTNSFIITATAGSCVVTKNYTVTVSASSCGAMTVNPTPADLPNGARSIPYNYTFVVSGATSAVTWSANGALPPGLSFNAGAASLAGTPTLAGNYTFTITATAGSCTASRTYTMSIAQCPAVTILPYVLPHAAIDIPFKLMLRANTNVGDYPASALTWSTSNMPTWLSINPASNILEGTPPAAGKYNFTVTVAANGCAATAVSRNYSLTVSGGTSASDIYLRTTLASANAITTPLVGVVNSGSVIGASTFAGVSGSVPGGIQCTSSNSGAKFTAPKNINLAKGTIEFYYTPNYTALNDSTTHTLFAGGVAYNSTKIELKYSYGLYAIVRGTNWAYSTAASNWNAPLWSSNERKRITLTWDTVSGVVNIYVNGVSVKDPANAVTTPNLTMGTTGAFGDLRVGYSEENASRADGKIDNLVISERVLEPFPVVTGGSIPNVPDPPTTNAERFGSYHWSTKGLCGSAGQSPCPADRLNWGTSLISTQGGKTVRVLLGPSDTYDLDGDGLFNDAGDYLRNANQSIKSLLEVAQMPAYTSLFNNNQINTYILTTYTAKGTQNQWLTNSNGNSFDSLTGQTTGEFTLAEYMEERDQYQALASYLAATYPTKKFIFSQNEPDHAFNGAYDFYSDSLDEFRKYVQAMADGVKLARQANPSAKVYSSMEFFLTYAAKSSAPNVGDFSNTNANTRCGNPDAKYDCPISRTALDVDVDYYSYSSYESINLRYPFYGGNNTTLKTVLKSNMGFALDKVLITHPQMGEKNFIIGEYAWGFTDTTTAATWIQELFDATRLCSPLTGCPDRFKPSYLIYYTSIVFSEHGLFSPLNGNPRTPIGDKHVYIWNIAP